MSHQDIAPPLPADQHDWDSTAAAAKRKLASRWPQSDPASVDSAVHLAVAIVSEMLETGVPVENVPGMVWSIAHKTLCSEHRKKEKRDEVSLDDEQDKGGRNIPSYPSAEEALLTSEFQTALDAAIMELPDPYRVPFVAHLLKDMSYEDIRETTGMRVGTARNNVCKAKKMVLAQMEEQGYSK